MPSIGDIVSPRSRKALEMGMLVPPMAQWMARCAREPSADAYEDRSSSVQSRARMSPMMSTDGTPSWLQALGIFGSGLEALPGVSNVTTVSPRAQSVLRLPRPRAGDSCCRARALAREGGGEMTDPTAIVAGMTQGIVKVHRKGCP